MCGDERRVPHLVVTGIGISSWLRDAAPPGIALATIGGAIHGPVRLEHRPSPLIALPPRSIDVGTPLE
jgi:hypothetical protein